MAGDVAGLREELVKERTSRLSMGFRNEHLEAESRKAAERLKREVQLVESAKALSEKGLRDSIKEVLKEKEDVRAKLNEQVGRVLTLLHLTSLPPIAGSRRVASHTRGNRIRALAPHAQGAKGRTHCPMG